MSVRAVLLVVMLLCLSEIVRGQAPSPEVLLQYRPRQTDVEIDNPAVADVPKCRATLENTKPRAFAVFDPSGVVLRRLVDADGDGQVDQWRYYRHGIEVYRDIDSNKNTKIDQCRWLNTGGSRWGIDRNEDGRIDEWKQLSAEEASRVAVNALAAGDLDMLKTVLLTQADTTELGVTPEVAGLLLRQVQEPEAAMRTVLAGAKGFNSRSKWMRFDAAMPGIIPADDGKASQDLTVYEGAMAITESGGGTAGQPGPPVLVQLGEMIRVGSVWKLTQVPQPVEGNVVQVSLGGVLMRPASPDAEISSELTPAMQTLISELQQLDQRSPAATAQPPEIIAHLKKRNALLMKLVAESKSQRQLDTWLRQLVNGLSNGVQLSDAESAQTLEGIIADRKKRSPGSPIIAYAEYRQLMAANGARMQQAQTQPLQQQAQAKWLADLKAFIEQYPAAEDTPDAKFQLALSYEFAGQFDEARQWYADLSQKHPETAPGRRSVGSMKRLALAGQPLTLAGKDASGADLSVAALRGKVVLVVFWAGWSNQFTADLPVLNGLLVQYAGSGFSVLGVNLDQTPDEMTAFVKQNKVTWPNIYQPGGLDAPLAEEFGLVNVPTMFLVDRSGRVVSNGLTIAELREKLPELMKP